MPDINFAVNLIIQIANDDTHGYDQEHRYGPDYDCSSLVAFVLNQAGFPIPTTAYTGNLYQYLTAAGFTECSEPWEAGDVHLKVGSHVCMSVSPTQIAEASINELGTTTGGQTGDQTGQEIWVHDYYTYSGGWTYHLRAPAADDGYTIYVISSIAGNLWQESNINPGLWEGAREGTWTELNHGFGLGQWTNTGGNTQGRLYQLHAWLSANGYADDSPQGQLAYILVENVWYPVEEAANFSSLSDFLASDSTDITMLTHAWNRGWEGIHDSSWDLRVQYANECYAYILAHKDDPPVSWIVTNNFLGKAQILNNALALWQTWGKGGEPEPPEPPEPKKKRKTPIWMQIRYHL